MVLLTPNEDLSAASGLLNIPHMEDIYHSFMDEALVTLGGDRGPAILHLPPILQQDNSTQSLPQPQQYNPFLKRAPLPSPGVKHTGAKVEHRDVEYTVLDRIDDKDGDDTRGIGRLKANEIELTFVIEALDHVNECLSLSFEGRRYRVDRTKPIGFSRRRYLLVVCQAIQEQDTNTEGTNG